MKKKWIKVVAVVGIMAVILTGLGLFMRTECEWCGEKKWCKTVTLSLLGEKSMCKGCRDLVMPISDNLKGLEPPQ